MPELTEQQAHLASLIDQKDKLAESLETLKTNASQTRDLYLKVLGAVEYLTQIGVSLPEPEPTEEEEEAPAEEETTEEG
jgi:Tfp pilus assembly protein PilN